MEQVIILAISCLGFFGYCVACLEGTTCFIQGESNLHERFVMGAGLALIAEYCFL
jgi:hypothetical protein